jgi:hypothetical protein
MHPADVGDVIAPAISPGRPRLYEEPLSDSRPIEDLGFVKAAVASAVIVVREVVATGRTIPS